MAAGRWIAGGLAAAIGLGAALLFDAPLNAVAQGVTLGTACTYNSDCPAPSICNQNNGRCMAQCREDRDCPGQPDTQCRREIWRDRTFMRRLPLVTPVLVQAPGEYVAHVCVSRSTGRPYWDHSEGYRDRNPTGHRCASNAECAEPLQCARGGCRPQCQTNADCGAGRECRVERWTTDRSNNQSTRFLELLSAGATAPVFDADGRGQALWGVCYQVGGGPVIAASGRPQLRVLPPRITPGQIRPGG